MLLLPQKHLQSSGCLYMKYTISGRSGLCSAWILIMAQLGQAARILDMNSGEASEAQEVLFSGV